MNGSARFLIDVAVFAAVAALLFWLISPHFSLFNRLLITDPPWGILSVFALFMIGLLIAVELAGIIVSNLLGRPLFE